MTGSVAILGEGAGGVESERRGLASGHAAGLSLAGQWGSHRYDLAMVSEFHRSVLPCFARIYPPSCVGCRFRHSPLAMATPTR